MDCFMDIPLTVNVCLYIHKKYSYQEDSHKIQSTHPIKFALTENIFTTTTLNDVEQQVYEKIELDGQFKPINLPFQAYKCLLRLPDSTSSSGDKFNALLPISSQKEWENFLKSPRAVVQTNDLNIMYEYPDIRCCNFSARPRGKETKNIPWLSVEECYIACQERIIACSKDCDIKLLKDKLQKWTPYLESCEVTVFVYVKDNKEKNKSIVTTKNKNDAEVTTKVQLEQPAIYRESDKEDAKCCFASAEQGNEIVDEVLIPDCKNKTFQQIYDLIIDKYVAIFPQKNFTNQALFAHTKGHKFVTHIDNLATFISSIHMTGNTKVLSHR